jgi:hypothetical protein
MSDRLLQEIAQIIHSYYQNRGKGLEKVAKSVIECVMSNSNIENISKSTNLTKLSLSSIDGMYLASTDKLLVQEFGRLSIYESKTKNTTLKLATWRVIDDAFFNDFVTVEELLKQGALVYLMK